MSDITKKSGIILTLCLIFQSSALSAGFAGGTGEPNDPYQIATAEQLIAIGSDRDLLEKSFILVADIDLDPNLPGGRIFEDALIAQDDSNDVSGHSGASFDGILDGQGYTITNLHIEGKYGYDAGLFGKFSGLVKDLHLTDVVVSGSPCGAIAGFNSGGMILRCHVAGRVSGVEDVGGLVGSHWDASIVECETRVQVTGDSDVGGMVGGGPGGTLMRCQVQGEVSGGRNVGGLVGQGHDGQIIECRTTAIVIGSNNVGGLIGDSDRTMIWRSSANCEVTAEQTAGGLIGSAYWGTGPLIADCYAQGSIIGSIVGGIAGEASHNQFLNCYAACEVFSLQVEGEELLVGGLFGKTRNLRGAPLTIACFWDKELSGVTASTGSDTLEHETGLTTEQMLNEAMFHNAGWDLSYVWMISEGEYPRLQWELID